MAESRPHISEPIKRLVRQRCGFGCVVCGSPIFEYDHITPYAQIQTHKAENITLLCTQCHNNKTTGRVSIDYVRKYNSNPVNKRGKDFTSFAFVHASEDNKLRLNAAGNILKMSVFDEHFYPFIILDGLTVLGCYAEEGGVMLNAMLFDKRGNCVLQIIKGEISVSVGVWDYSFVGKVLTVRSGPRRIELKLEFVGHDISILKGSIYGIFGARLTLDKNKAVLHRPHEGNSEQSLTGNDCEQCCFIFMPGGNSISKVHKFGMPLSPWYKDELRLLFEKVSKHKSPKLWIMFATNLVSVLCTTPRPKRSLETSHYVYDIALQVIPLCEQHLMLEYYACSLQWLGSAGLSLVEAGMMEKLDPAISALQKALTLPDCINSPLNKTRVKRILGECWLLKAKLNGDDNSKKVALLYLV